MPDGTARTPQHEPEAATYIVKELTRCSHPHFGPVTSWGLEKQSQSFCLLYENSSGPEPEAVQDVRGMAAALSHHCRSVPEATAASIKEVALQKLYLRKRQGIYLHTGGHPLHAIQLIAAHDNFVIF